MKDTTHITVVLDDSGSMDMILNDTLGGYNTFVREQKKSAKPGDTFSLVTFKGYTHRNVNISTVEELTTKTYKPNGGTPLLDTLGNSILELGQYLSSLNEEDRPAKVLFVIITDGEENASREYSKVEIKEKITHQSDVYKWEFVYLGANQDAIKEGAKYGISSLNSMSFGANKHGLASTYDVLTRSVNNFKAASVGTSYAASSGITAEDRTKMMGGEANVSSVFSGNPLDPNWTGTAVIPVTGTFTANVASTAIPPKTVSKK
jgi:hypothetical protein